MWRKSSLRQKILIGYFILVVVIGAVGAWSIYNVQQLNKFLIDITKENYISVLAAENMIGALERQDSGALLLLLGERQQGVELYQAGRQEYQYWFDKEKRNITLPNEGELVRRIEDNYSKYSQLLDAINSPIISDDGGGAHRMYLDEIYPLFSTIRADLQNVLAINHQEFMDGNARSSDTARQVAVSVALVSGSAVMFGIFFAFTLSTTVVQPVIRLTETVKRIREGNLSEEVAVSTFDELGNLAWEFNSMLQRLRVYENAIYGKLALEQQKALAIIQAMADGIVLIGQNQQVVMLNPAAEQILGIKSDDAAGKDAGQVFRQSEIVRLLEQAGNSDQMPVERTVMINAGSQEHFYEIEVTPFKTWEETGKAILLKDVTNFKLIDKKKAEFLSGIAHEIRTPLTSITMGLGILNESSALKENRSAIEILGVIQEETARLTTLMDEFLELSRFESSGIELKTQQLEVADLLERTIASFRVQAEGAHVRLELSLPDPIPFVVWDAGKIQSVVSNLLTNALRYTPAGGTIVVKAGNRVDAVLLSVTDTGTGIPAQLQKKIFDKFFQMDARPAGKVGLGLAICKAIVKKHGGKIWVDSREEGQGATFFVELPIRADLEK